MSKFKGKKTDNAKVDAKVLLRQAVLAEITVDEAAVLDVFCGKGEMYGAVWHKAKMYTGIDKKKYFDSRVLVCGTAEKAIRLVDIKKYNIFDIDAYGSPYEILSYVVANVGSTHRKLGFVLTDGVQMDMRMGRVCTGIRQLTGIKTKIIKNVHSMHDELIYRIIENVCFAVGGSLRALKLAKGVTGSGMRYYSFIIDRDVV